MNNTLQTTISLSDGNLKCELNTDEQKLEVELENKSVQLSSSLSNTVLRGYSSYELWLQGGNTGTVEDYLNSLQGEQGETPYVGNNGNWWIGNEDTGYQVLNDATLTEVSNTELEALFNQVGF